MQRTIQQLRQPISIRAKQYFAKTWVFYVLLVPALLDVLVFQYIPMYGVQIAFRRYKASQGMSLLKSGSTLAGMPSSTLQRSPLVIQKSLRQHE